VYVQNRVEGAPDAGTIEYESWSVKDSGAVDDASGARDAGAIEFESWRTPRGERGNHG
jgi:hypothetical protein